jgi:hypothetical protein
MRHATCDMRHATCDMQHPIRPRPPPRGQCQCPLDQMSDPHVSSRVVAKFRCNRAPIFGSRLSPAHSHRPLILISTQHAPYSTHPARGAAVNDHAASVESPLAGRSASVSRIHNRMPSRSASDASDTPMHIAPSVIYKPVPRYNPLDGLPVTPCREKERGDCGLSRWRRGFMP